MPSMSILLNMLQVHDFSFASQLWILDMLVIIVMVNGLELKYDDYNAPDKHRHLNFVDPDQSDQRVFFSNGRQIQIW